MPVKATTAIPCPETEGKGLTLSVTAELSTCGNNPRPRFAVTGEIYRAGANDIETGGCIHDTVRKYFPRLGPVIDLHLSDDTGTPMHAVANGVYFAELGKTDTLANHLRVSSEYAASLCEQTRAAIANGGDKQRPVADACIALAEAWQAQADDAVAIIKREALTANGVSFPRSCR